MSPFLQSSERPENNGFDFKTILSSYFDFSLNWRYSWTVSKAAFQVVSLKAATEVNCTVFINTTT